MVFAKQKMDEIQYAALVAKDFPTILSIMRTHKDLANREEALQYIASPGATGNTLRHNPPVIETVEKTAQVHENTGTVTLSKFGTKKGIFTYINCQDPLQRKVICLSRTASTWDSYLTAWRSYEHFCIVRQVPFYFPCDVETITDYLSYLRYEKKVEATTALSYLSALRTLHLLNRYDDSAFDDGLVDIFKEGITNDSLVVNSTTISRYVMTWEVLQLLGYHLHYSTNFNRYDIQVIWLACLLGYFGSLRMGEILSYTTTKFDPVRGINWNKIKLIEGTLIIVARLPKCSEDKLGKVVNYLPYSTNYSLCPVYNAIKLVKMNPQAVKGDPVFKLSNGKLLTMQKMNQILKQCLKPVLPDATYTCHSFRKVHEYKGTV